MSLKKQIRVGNTRKPDNGADAMNGPAFYEHALLYLGTVLQLALDVAQEMGRKEATMKETAGNLEAHRYKLHGRIRRSRRSMMDPRAPCTPI